MFAEARDEDFRTQVEPHRRAITLHCYRMLGSLQEAEEVAQESCFAPGSGSMNGGRAARPAPGVQDRHNGCLDLLKTAAGVRFPICSPRRRSRERPSARHCTRRFGSSRRPIPSSTRPTMWSPDPNGAWRCARASAWPSLPRCNSCRPSNGRAPARGRPRLEPRRDGRACSRRALLPSTRSCGGRARMSNHGARRAGPLQEQTTRSSCTAIPPGKAGSPRLHHFARRRRSSVHAAQPEWYAGREAIHRFLAHIMATQPHRYRLVPVAGEWSGCGGGVHGAACGGGLPRGGINLVSMRCGQVTQMTDSRHRGFSRRSASRAPSQHASGSPH